MLSDLESTAIELVTEFGSNSVYTNYSAGSYDPATSKVTHTSTAQTTKAVLLDLTLQSNGLSLKYGTEILAGDKEAYVLPPATPVSINPGKDTLTIGGIQYTVVTFKEINPTGSKSIVWFLYLRR